MNKKITDFFNKKPRLENISVEQDDEQSNAEIHCDTNSSDCDTGVGDQLDYSTISDENTSQQNEDCSTLPDDKSSKFTSKRAFKTDWLKEYSWLKLLSKDTVLCTICEASKDPKNEWAVGKIIPRAEFYKSRFDVHAKSLTHKRNLLIAPCQESFISTYVSFLIVT